MQGFKSATLATFNNCHFGTFEPLHGFRKFLMLNAFFLCTLKKSFSKLLCILPKTQSNHEFYWLKMQKKIFCEMYLFQEVGKPEMGFANHEFIQLQRTSARRARVPLVTVWTSGWQNHFRFPNFLEEAFSEISLINR